MVLILSSCESPSWDVHSTPATAILWNLSPHELWSRKVRVCYTRFTMPNPKAIEFSEWKEMVVLDNLTKPEGHKSEGVWS